MVSLRQRPEAAVSETLSASLPGSLEARITVVLETLCARSLTIATAESCTGGLVASVLTDVEGCGHAFERGFVTYTEEAKVQDLGVPPALLEAHSAVSREVATAMAEGGLRRTAADLVLAVTGYAGPGGPEAGEGLVFVALAGRNRPIVVREHHFGPVGRGVVRLEALGAGISLLEMALDQN